MTAPALLMLADGARTDASALILSRLKVRLHELRPNLHCQTAFVGPGQPSITASARTLQRQGYSEAVCVPLSAARVADTIAAMAAAVDVAQRETPDLQFSLAEPLGAPGGLFSLLDRRLHDELAARSQRELDALVLLHDGDADTTESAPLNRRARVWSAHHRLPVTLAPLSSTHAARTAVAAHAANGRRHVGVAWLSIFDDETQRHALAATPRVAAVAAPLGCDDAVIDAVVAQYSVAALRSLDEIALAS